jgi:hypothetical protein
MIGYKLFRVRKDGSLGSLFINQRQRIKVGEWMPAEDHPTKGYAHRPGWHICSERHAPHLSERGRRWFRVEFTGERSHKRPDSQGGLWYTATSMRVIEAA